MLLGISNICHKFGVRYFPKVTFPRATPQVSIFLLCNFLKVRLGPLRHRRLQLGPSAAARMVQGAQRRGQNSQGAEQCGLDRLGKLIQFSILLSFFYRIVSSNDIFNFQMAKYLLTCTTRTYYYSMAPIIQNFLTKLALFLFLILEQQQVSLSASVL